MRCAGDAPRLLGVTAAKETRVGDGRDMGWEQEGGEARGRAGARWGTGHVRAWWPWASQPLLGRLWGQHGEWVSVGKRLVRCRAFWRGAGTGPRPSGTSRAPRGRLFDVRPTNRPWLSTLPCTSTNPNRDPPPSSSLLPPISSCPDSRPSPFPPGFPHPHSRSRPPPRSRPYSGPLRADALTHRRPDETAAPRPLGSKSAQDDGPPSRCGRLVCRPSLSPSVRSPSSLSQTFISGNPLSCPTVPRQHRMPNVLVWSRNPPPPQVSPIPSHLSVLLVTNETSGRPFLILAPSAARTYAVTTCQLRAKLFTPRSSAHTSQIARLLAPSRTVILVYCNL